ncbi:hypothetical protein Tco_0584248 [Tanacetum coccineum]
MSIRETTKIIDNISKAGVDERTKLLKALNKVSKTLEADSSLKKEMKKIAKSHNTTSGNLSSLIGLLNNAKLLEILTKMDAFHSTLNTLSTQCASISKLLKEEPEFNQRLLREAEGYIQNSSKGWLLKCFKPSGGENLEKQVVVWQKPPSYTKGEPMQIVTTTKEPKDEGTETSKEEPTKATRVVPISSVRPLMRINPELEMMSSTSTVKLTDTVLEIPTPNTGAEIKLIGSSRPQPTDTTSPPQPESPQVIQRTDKGKGTATDDTKKPTRKLMHASREVCQDHVEPIRVPYKIHGKIYQLTNDEIQAHLEKEEKIKKASEEAKLLAMTKSELMKVIHIDSERHVLILRSLKVLKVVKSSRRNKMLRRKRKHMELEHEIRIPGLEFVVDAVLTYLVMASNITTLENTRFCLKLRKLIEDHPDQEKLQFKKVKLESVRYKLG